MIAALVIALAPTGIALAPTGIALAPLWAAPTAAASGHDVKWTAPAVITSGAAVPVRVEISVGAEGSSIPAWMLQAAAFAVNDAPLGERKGESIALAAGTKLTLELDLAAALAGAEIDGQTFSLAYAGDDLALSVRHFKAAAKEVDFTTLPVAELARHQVLMRTNRGILHIELWPEVAPEHARNFLDLCHTRFYDGVLFHRVIPGFMIQGGDPTGTGRGNGPRTLKAEFNERRHEPGVLSMARTEGSFDSASCQFFIVHMASPQLDRQYTTFGKLVSGLEVVEKIANTKRNSLDMPLDPQVIEQATVVVVK